MGWYDKAEEDALYEQSRSLKFKAREMRKKRLEGERRNTERLKVEAVKKEQAEKLKATQAKTDRDNRIRKALLSMNDSFKEGGLKIEGPDSWSSLGAKKPCFRLYDSKTLQWVQINVVHNGYQWD